MIAIIVTIFLCIAWRFRARQYEEGTAMNLHQIGLAILLYENDHNQAFPNSLVTLYRAEQVAPAVFVDISTNDTPAEGATPDEIAVNLTKPGHCSYTYVGAGLTDQTATGDTVVAYFVYGTNAIFPPGSAEALFGDGHCMFLAPSLAADMLKKAATTRPVVLSFGGYSTTAPATHP
jgi:hypothetical protein